MSIVRKILLAFALTFALGAVPNAVARPTPPAPSVLPTGGGQALLDPSES
jgi:hypothetical protein